MDYIQQLFGKSLQKLQYNDVAIFFQTEKTENDLIEFKSYSPKSEPGKSWNGIFESVCAFLNSSGGVIIWGAPKEKTVSSPGGKKTRSCHGDLTGMDAALVKDTVVSRISSNLVPLASNFQVEILANGAGNSVCVIEVQPSNYAPHQSGRVYYMRLDGQTVAAPHHYVEALFKRITFPNLEGYLKFGAIYGKKEFGNNRQLILGMAFDLSIQIWNFSRIQNEENVYFTLSNSQAKVFNHNLKQDAEYANNGKVILKQNAQQILAFGAPYSYTERFWIDKEVWGVEPNEIDFIILFGGKHSPLKLSSYKIDKQAWSRAGKFEDYILDKKENIFNYDHVDALGVTREDQLKAALGRLP